LSGKEPSKRFVPRISDVMRDHQGVPSGLRFVWHDQLVSLGLLRTPSIWFLAALAALVLLEIPSATGPFLDRFGGDFLAGWLGQLVLLSLLIDALRGRLPRGLTLIPLIFYLSYYAAFWQQEVQITRKSEEVRKSNPGRVLDFDPERYSLVMEAADVFAATYSVPAVYTRDPAFIRDEYISYRLIARENVRKFLSVADDDVQVLSIYWDDVIQPNVKELRYPERPPHAIISVAVRNEPGEGWRDWNIGERMTSLILEARVIGEFKTAYVRRLSIVPFLTVSCKSSARSSVRICQSKFMTEDEEIESRAESVDKALYSDPVSIMLGLKSRSKEEMINFPSLVGSEPVRAARGEDEAFEVLRAVIDEQNPTLSWTTTMLVASDAARLGPLAAGMAKRFLELSRPDSPDLPGRREQAALLAVALAALGPAEFAGVQGQLIDLARNNNLRDQHPLLYLRLADAGPKLYSIYRDQFLAQNATPAEKQLAALAICRIGQADSELMSAIKSEWADESGEAKDDNYRAALFVTLARLGQEGTLKNSMGSNSRALQVWYDAVLSGRGRTEVGPNNCMPIEWGGSYVPPFMAPRLRWTQQQWRAAD
jgi:hypothetical protein